MFKLTPFHYLMGVICIIPTISANAADIKTPAGIIVKQDVKHDISLPLRFLQGKVNPLNHPYTSISKVASADSTSPLANSLVPLRGFQGMGVGLGSYMPNESHPDTNGSVGMTQYFQFTNPDIAVFDKMTGQVAAGFPKPSNSLWAGFGGVCEEGATGPITVNYDHLAHRWLLSQYAMGNFQTGPYYHCVALSTSEDATGSYYRYAFELDSFSDHNRSALWPDAYYFSFHLLGRVSNGPIACALNRDNMLQGLPSTMQCKPLTLQGSSQLLPADLEGNTLPATGQPEYFIGLEMPNTLKLYKFHVDFEFPLNSSVVSINLPVSAFSKACVYSAGDDCAVQPNTFTRLNVFSDSLMRIVYRQFPEYGSVVATHTIEGPQPKYSPTVRWYELRLLNNTPTFNPIVYQQGTLSSDSKNRYIPSITIDKAGGIAVGYSISTTRIYPSIELSSRNASDPLNTMTVQPLVTGRGAQINGISEWGSMSKMAIDPVDNCTFWYTNEYLKATGSINWSTYIINFKLAGCT